MVTTIERSKLHVVGLGWLGFPLAKRMQREGYLVSGTVRTAEKQAIIGSVTPNIACDIFRLYSHDIINKARLNGGTLVLNIPPGRRNFCRQTFTKAMISLIDNAFEAGLQYLCFISTTSVFNGTQGVIYNNTDVAPLSESAKAHVLIEQHLRSNYASKHSVVRPGGLVGPKVYETNIAANRQNTIHQNEYRHPIFSLCNKQDIASGHELINLVHLDDMLNVLSTLISKRKPGEFNVAAEQHPNKAEYYKWCAQALNLPEPGFSKSEAKPAKVIDASNTFSELGLSLVHQSPYTMLPI